MLFMVVWANVARWTDKDIPGFIPSRVNRSRANRKQPATYLKCQFLDLEKKYLKISRKEKQAIKDDLLEKVRGGDKEALKEAEAKGEITSREAKEIKEKEAKEDPFVVGMKHLNIQEMAKRLKNATPEQKEKLYPVFKKKFQNAKKEGTITKDDQQKYYEMLENLR